jgi:4'-phosphopantetheinyl transferase
VSRSLRIQLVRWPSADASRIGDADARVYTASLLATDAEVRRAAATLSLAERDRLATYSNSIVSRRFAIGRAIVRDLLGAVLDIAPEAVQLREGVHGKPALARGSSARPLWFSIAHCDELLLIALSKTAEIGVDVERTRSIESWQRVADRVLAPAERAQLDRAVEHSEDAGTVFLRHWCRVESELKAIGCGIHGLDAHRAGIRPAGLRIADLRDLPLPDALASGPARYQAAVALCSPAVDSARHVASAPNQQISPTAAPARASTR